MPKCLVLGPQRPTLNLGEAVGQAGFPEGPFAVISAGWQEAEGDIDDVRDVLGRELIDLGLYRRVERVLADDDDLRRAYRTRQDRLLELQRLHRLRLGHLMLAARQILEGDGETSLAAAERRHAVAQLRSLDRHHYQRILRIHALFAEQFGPATSIALADQIAALRAELERCDTVLITGGNVAVLVNRMQLFGLGPLLATKHLVAWSAGVMALAERVVLFHDHTPLLRRDAEIFGPGLNLLTGHVFLPDAERRLRKQDAVRMSLLSRRFSPDTCVILDSGAAALFDDGAVVAVDGARRLTRGGRLARMRRS